MSDLMSTPAQSFDQAATNSDTHYASTLSLQFVAMNSRDVSTLGTGSAARQQAQQQQQQHPAHTPFFADATLDLEEAHDIADTPESEGKPTLRSSSRFVLTAGQRSRLVVPSLLALVDEQEGEQQFVNSSVSLSPILTRPSQGNGGNVSNDDDHHHHQFNSMDLTEEGDDHQHQHLVHTVGIHDGSPPPIMEVGGSSIPNNGSNHGLNYDDNTNYIINNNNTKSKFARITNLETETWDPDDMLEVDETYFGHGEQEQQNQQSRRTVSFPEPPRSPPRWPRDIPWAVGFVLLVPLGLFWPIVLAQQQTGQLSPLTTHTSFVSLAILHTLWWTGVAAVVLSRTLYRTAGGGDGDDARHVIATVLMWAAPISVSIYAALTVMIWAWCPKVRTAAVIPLWYTIRDVYLFRRWKRRSQPAAMITGMTVHANASAAASASRHAFFQALTIMALDIVSRSLRRLSFYRVMFVILIVQFVTLLLWRWALLDAVATGSWLLLIGAVLGGKWATGTIARFLSLLASGGVFFWFVQQDALLRNLPVMQQQQQQPLNDQNHNDEEDPGKLPEAYRTVDASVYQSVLSMDENLDDDDYELNDDDDEAPSRRDFAKSGLYSNSPRRESNTSALWGQQQQHHDNPHNRSTVKSILAAGLTVSFGSVAQCGLLGGLAQFVWSQVRKVEVARNVWWLWKSSALSSSSPLYAQAPAQNQGMSNIINNGSGFRGMIVGTGPVYSSSSSTGNVMRRGRRNHQRCGTCGGGRRTCCCCCGKNSGIASDGHGGLSSWSEQMTELARSFVRSHSDLAMCHVAAYYKGYQRSARDVAILIDQSGVEPLLHDDITTHMCSCVGGSISGLIVIFTGSLLLHQRRLASVTITDAHVVEGMLLAFILSYTLIFTVMEPLRAAIKAVYVSFAQYPQSLSHAFPLIYHRLSRLSESNLS